MPEVSLFFGALLALIQVPMTFAVGLRRRAVKVSFLDGGDETLMRRIRAHGNFTETVPISIIAMAAAETFGTSDQILWIGGSLLVIGRLTHYLVMLTFDAGVIRLLTILMTLIPMAGFSVLALYGYLT